MNRAGTLKTTVRSVPKSEDCIAQRGRVSCLRVHAQLMVKWDGIQAIAEREGQWGLRLDLGNE